MKRFLDRLREESLFDLAEVYLDSLAAKDMLPAKLKADLPLERLLLAYDSVNSLRSLDLRAKKLDQVEAGLKEFVEKNVKHPRRSEARLKLAEILLSRGKDANDRAKSGKGSDQDREIARRSFEAARGLFSEILGELQPILQEMQGARISKEDTEQIALRDQYADQYRQAEMLKSLCARFAGETYPNDAPEFKKWLETAEAELSDIIKKTPGKAAAGRHVLSLLYRGEVQASLGKTDEAFDSLTRVYDIEEPGIFRTWRVEAARQLVQLMANEKQNKHEAILGKADALLKTMTKAERTQSNWLQLQLAVAEGQLDWSKQLEKQANGGGRAKAQRSEAKNTLQSLAKKPSVVQEKAKALLGDLGFDASSKSEKAEAIPEFKKCSEGITLANDRLSRIDGSNVSLELLRNRRKEAQADEVAGIDAEIEALQQENRRLAAEAEKILLTSLKLFGRDEPREEMHNARHLLAFAMLKQDKFWEAASLADFVTRTSGGNSISLSSGRFARAAYAQLLDTVDASERPGIQAAFESLANFMLTNWPEAAESQDAALVLLNQALQKQDWDLAERYADLIPSTSEKSPMVRRELGIVLYRRYLIAVDELRKQNEQPGPEQAALLERAELWLKQGFEPLVPEQLNQRAVEAGNCLTATYLKQRKLKEANETLHRAEVGPLAAMQRKDLAIDGPVRLESLRLNLQVMLLLATESGAPLDPSNVEGMISQMSAISQETPEGASRMAGPLIQLAQDLRQQIEQVKAPGEKLKLTKGIQVLLSQLGQVSTDIGVLDWSASNLLTLAQGLDATQNSSLVIELANQAKATYDRLLAIEKEKPGSLAAAGRKMEDVSLRQAIALRLLGKPETAVEQLQEVLASNPASPLLPQMELAKAYQAWGTNTKNVAHLKVALFGQGRFWGWNSLSKKLNQNEKAFEYFCESRYQLAETQFQLAMLEQGPKRNTELEKAKVALRTSVQANPRVQESNWYASMDQLLRKIQKELKQDAIGMKEFSTP